MVSENLTIFNPLDTMPPVMGLRPLNLVSFLPASTVNSQEQAVTEPEQTKKPDNSGLVFTSLIALLGIIYG